MPRLSNCPFIQQPAFPCHGPLLFVIPPAPACRGSAAERICGAPFVCPAPIGPRPPLVIHRTLLETSISPFYSGFPPVGRRTTDPLGCAPNEQTKSWCRTSGSR